MVSREKRGAKNNRVWLGLALASALAVSACSSDTNESVSATAESRLAATTALGTSAASEAAVLVFDDLGGGSSIIQVYPGVQNTEVDKQYNGTFNDGDIVGALCKTEGRQVSSDPSAGEVSRTSSEWVRINGTPGVDQYATAVYVENSDDLLGKLPVC